METEIDAGFYCATIFASENVDILLQFYDFLSLFTLPFIIMFHNYLRISLTLFRSVKEAKQLRSTEGYENQ